MNVDRQALAILRLVERLEPLRPRSVRAERTRWRIEALVKPVLLAGGLRGVERLVRAVNRRRPVVARSERRPYVRGWQGTLGGHGGVLLISTVSNRGSWSVSVDYRPAPAPLTARERAIASEQDAFYARFTTVGQRVYRSSRPVRLSAADRLVLLVGELQADVNNGGFDQYLANKGRRRAAAALAALRVIGAARAARLLATALDPATTPAGLARLDARFLSSPEDLAVLTMRRAGARDRAVPGRMSGRS